MGTRKTNIDNAGKVHLTNPVMSINKDGICLTDISPKQNTELVIHIASKASTKRSKLWSDRSRSTYPPKLRVA